MEKADEYEACREVELESAACLKRELVAGRSLLNESKYESEAMFSGSLKRFSNDISTLQLFCFI